MSTQQISTKKQNQFLQHEAIDHLESYLDDSRFSWHKVSEFMLVVKQELGFSSKLAKTK